MRYAADRVILRDQGDETVMRRTNAVVAAIAVLALAGTVAEAQVGPDFDPTAWELGPRWKVEGEVEIWNPVMRKIQAGEPIIGGTIRATDARTYCAQAAAGYDFTWTEMQHEAITWEQVARMWRTCPGPAVPGTRVAHESEGNLQMPVDMGALVIMVPTVDDVEEARRAVDWTYFPPMGRRSAGGGQGPSEMWNDVPGGFRQTWNDNVVLILMIETLEGVKNAREIARIPGVDGLFAAAGDIGNFSGSAEGEPEYEMLITEIVEAAQDAGKIVCGPLRWMGVRPEYTCFQASHEMANLRRGAEAELEAAWERWDKR
jgi:2-keto-3-deoxy-L-rhamnonate aldolase RhmA